MLIARASLVVSCACAASLGDDGVSIGRHLTGGGNGDLHAHIDLPQPVPVGPSVFPGFDGYATGFFGFSNTPLDHPDDGFYMLLPAADVSAAMVGLGGTLVIHNGLDPMTPGDAMDFGQPFFDYHPIVQLAAGGSGFARFVLHDSSGTHGSSEEFQISFIAHDPACPADLGSQGGVHGADGAHDNNDFIAFVDLFFAQHALADVGSQGGAAGPDAAFDNNDFVLFIDRFFAGCGA